jgi:Ser/Thr protein kinase RdoA (MazF antagonist)
LEGVREEALEAAQQLVASSIVAGRGSNANREFRVTDEAGTIVLTLPFRTVLDSSSGS